MKIGELVRTEDFKSEKHVPFIGAPSTVKKGEKFEVEVTVGKEIPHPNTVEHHIKWMDLYAKFEGKPVVQVGHFDLGPTFGEPSVKVVVSLPESATLIAVIYCNIHGLWENSVEVKAE